MRWAALIVAAGNGERFGGFKQLAVIAGRPMLSWSIEALSSIAEFESFVVVTAPHAMQDVEVLSRALLGDRLCDVVNGGATRQESVRRGLDRLTGRCDAVAIHDGARPCVQSDDIRRAMNAVAPGRASLLAHRITDTIKKASEPGLIVQGTLARDDLWGAQTPQLATLHDLSAAHRRSLESGIVVTDDVALLEGQGVETVIIPSSSENMKVTHQADRLHAEAILNARAVRGEINR